MLDSRMPSTGLAGCASSAKTTSIQLSTFARYVYAFGAFGPPFLSLLEHCTWLHAAERESAHVSEAASASVGTGLSNSLHDTYPLHRPALSSGEWKALPNNSRCELRAARRNEAARVRRLFVQMLLHARQHGNVHAARAPTQETRSSRNLSTACSLIKAPLNPRPSGP